MKPIRLTNIEGKILVLISFFGLLVPNGVFIYFFITSPETASAAMSNPISLVFIVEAFFLTFLFAWLLRKAGVKKPTGLVFIIMSLVGSMVFSVPATLYLIARNQVGSHNEQD